MHRIMTEAEAEESDVALNAWWSTLDWNIKNHFRAMISAIQNPMCTDLPMYYAPETPTSPPVYGPPFPLLATPDPMDCDCQGPGRKRHPFATVDCLHYGATFGGSFFEVPVLETNPVPCDCSGPPQLPGNPPHIWGSSGCLKTRPYAVATGDGAMRPA